METYETILAAMAERYRELCGFEADAASDIGIRLRVLAGELARLYEQVAEARRQTFPQTSTGEFLNRHAEARGFSRKQAVRATGTLRFSRTLPSGSHIPIGKGVVCATGPDNQVQFATAVSHYLPAGALTVDIPAHAVAAGADGNVAAGSVRLLVSSVPGITGVTNPDAFDGGVDEEGDDALRERLLDGYKNISNGANRAFYYDIAMEDDGVSSAYVIPQARGRGTVDVVICGPSSTEAATAARLAETFAELREINVSVQVRRAQRVPVDAAASIAVADGYVYSSVAERCAGALRAYLGELAVGEPLYVARLSAALLGVEGVANCSVAAPGSDRRVEKHQIIRPGNVAVALMEVS